MPPMDSHRSRRWLRNHRSWRWDAGMIRHLWMPLGHTNLDMSPTEIIVLSGDDADARHAHIGKLSGLSIRQIGRRGGLFIRSLCRAAAGYPARGWRLRPR